MKTKASNTPKLKDADSQLLEALLNATFLDSNSSDLSYNEEEDGNLLVDRETLIIGPSKTNKSRLLTFNTQQDLLALWVTPKHPIDVIANATKLLQQLKVIHEHLAQAFKVPASEVSINIISGLRTPKHNASVGGAKKSKHMIGQAADFKVSVSKKLVNPQIVAQHILSLMRTKKIVDGGFHAYGSFTHYDIRGSRKTWK